MQIELSEITELTKAINRLCDVMSKSTQPVIQVEPEHEEVQEVDEVEVEVEETKAEKKKADVIKMKEQKAVEVEPPKEVMSVEDAQAFMGTIAQEFDPGWVIAGIKHFGEGRLSELSDEDRGKLVDMMTVIYNKLKEDNDLPNKISPMDLVAEVANG